MTSEIRKRLSANDLGETGSHQAGILVPKEQQILSFFPLLDRSVKNPRMSLVMHERRDGTRWTFNYVYYNSKLFEGTRNEYRLTCMTGYLRAAGANVGDEIVFTRNKSGSYLTDLDRAGSLVNDDDVLVLSGGWKIIS